MELEQNKKLCLKINPDVLQVPADLPDIPGMFGWFNVGQNADLSKSKINFIGGSLFGVPGMVRMNLAFPPAKMEEIVSKLNSIF